MEERKNLYQGQREGVNVKSENGNDYISVSVDGLTVTVATKLDFIEVDVRRVMEAIDILSAAVPGMIQEKKLPLGKNLCSGEEMKKIALKFAASKDLCGAFERFCEECAEFGNQRSYLKFLRFI